MAENKILNTRVQLKYDLYSEWQKVESTFKPLKGEICIVNPGTKLSDATNVPCLMKVGDGENFFKDLPWVSALAADVYEWAKKSAPDWNDFPAVPAEKLPNIPADKLPEIPAEKQSKDYGKVTANTGSIEADALHDTFAIKGEGVISTSATNDTITIKADLKDYALKTDIPTNHKTIQNPVSDPTASGSATAFIASISQNANGEITVTKKHITAADLNLESAMHFIGVSTTDPSTGTVTIGGKIHTPANGDVVLYNKKEYVYGNGKWNELGDEGSHALKTIEINAGEGLSGGGDLSQNRTISLSDATKASLAKADTAKQIQTAVTNKITDNAHVLASLTQNANGDISYEVKKLTPADIGAQPAGNYALKSELPVVNDGQFTVSGTGALTGSGSMTANQAGNTAANLDIKNKGISAEKTKAYVENYGDDSEEVWVFYSGTSTILV